MTVGHVMAPWLFCCDGNVFDLTRIGWRRKPNIGPIIADARRDVHLDRNPLRSASFLASANAAAWPVKLSSLSPNTATSRQPAGGTHCSSMLALSAAHTGIWNSFAAAMAVSIPSAMPKNAAGPSAKPHRAAKREFTGHHFPRARHFRLPRSIPVQERPVDRGLRVVVRLDQRQHRRTDAAITVRRVRDKAKARRVRQFVQMAAAEVFINQRARRDGNGWSPRGVCDRRCGVRRRSRQQGRRA